MADVAPLLGRIIKNGYETICLNDLFDLLALDRDDLLGGLRELGRLCEEHELVIRPPVSEGNFEELRVIEAGGAKGVDLSDLIEKGEGNHLEFKESAFSDKNKMRHAPDLNPKDYISEDVQLSALKTLAAFSNTRGGKLLIGVADDGSIEGIESDFYALGVGTCDEWQLRFASMVEKYFHKGRKFQSFLHFEFISHDEKTVVVIDVKPTPSIDLVKKKPSWMLFVRQGNRTVHLDWTDLEDFYTVEKKF